MFVILTVDVVFCSVLFYSVLLGVLVLAIFCSWFFLFLSIFFLGSFGSWMVVFVCVRIRGCVFLFVGLVVVVVKLLQGSEGIRRQCEGDLRRKEGNQ